MFKQTIPQGLASDGGRHLNTVEAASYLRRSERILKRWRAEGHGPAYVRVQGRITYRLEDLREFSAANVVAA